MSFFDFEDLAIDLAQESLVAPTGRELTPEEENIIRAWSMSRQLQFRLAKQYGNLDLIPNEELQKVHELALAEVCVESVAAYEPETIDSVSTPITDIIKTEFNPLDRQEAIKYNGSTKFDFKALWDNYPKRLGFNSGEKYGTFYAKYRIRTEDQYNLALQIVKGYAQSLKKQYGPGPYQYAVKYDNFIERLEEFVAAASFTEKPTTRVLMQRGFVRPYRPKFPWEESHNKEDWPLKKRMAYEVDLKIKERYHDKTNDQYWYYYP